MNQVGLELLPAALEVAPVVAVVPAPSARAARFYRPELDGLRFFAFLAVYLNHTLLFGTEEGHHRHLTNGVAQVLGTVGVAGAFGVDLFFVLSAYLITELLLRERAVKGTLDVRAFYLRRVLRIWPLYFLFLAFARLLTLFVPTEKLSWGHLAAFAFFSGNWAYLLHPVATVAAPLWSVSVEEQFYIFWPWVVRRMPGRRIALLAVGMVLGGVFLRLGLGLAGLNEPWVSKSSVTRVDGISAGVLLAVVLNGRMPRLGKWTRRALGLSGTGTLLAVAAFFHLFTGTVQPLRLALGWPLVAASCAAVLISALGSSGGLSAVLASPPVVYLGRISFGLYVFHQVGLLVGERVFPDFASRGSHWLGHFGLGLALTFVLAAASYRWVEQPFLRLKQRRYTVVSSRPEAA